MLNLNLQTRCLPWESPFPFRAKGEAYVQRELYAGKGFAKGSPARSQRQPRFPFMGNAAENPQSAEGSQIIMDILPDRSEPPKR